MAQRSPIQLFPVQTPLRHESTHALSESIIVMAFQ